MSSLILHILLGKVLTNHMVKSKALIGFTSLVFDNEKIKTSDKKVTELTRNNCYI